MTLPPRAWAPGETSIDRAGGVLRLHLLAKRCVGRRFELREHETAEWIGVRLFVEKVGRGQTARDHFEEWITCAPAARSVAVREDQRDRVAGDLYALESIFRAEVVRIAEDVPELELRAINGDR